MDADFGLTDLYENIEAGNYPSWTVNFQVLTPAEAEKFKCTCPDILTSIPPLTPIPHPTDNIFDLTKGTVTQCSIDACRGADFGFMTPFRVETGGVYCPTYCSRAALMCNCA